MATPSLPLAPQAVAAMQKQWKGRRGKGGGKGNVAANDSGRCLRVHVSKARAVFAVWLKKPCRNLAPEDKGQCAPDTRKTCVRALPRGTNWAEIPRSDFDLSGNGMASSQRRGAEEQRSLEAHATVASVLPFKTPLPNANLSRAFSTPVHTLPSTRARASRRPNAALHSVCQPLNGLGNGVLTATAAYDAEFVIGRTKVVGRVLVSPNFSPPLPYDLLVGKTVYEKFGGFICLDNDVVYVDGYSFNKRCGAKVQATGDPDVPLRYTYDATKIPEKAAELFRQLPGALGLQRGAGGQTERTPALEMRRPDQPPSNVAAVCACSDSKLTWTHVAVMQRMQTSPPTPRD